eukprot:jgi/Galph1/4145/GphlegSOOS_G2829.1
MEPSNRYLYHQVKTYCRHLFRTFCTDTNSISEQNNQRLRFFGKPNQSNPYPFAPCNSLKLPEEEFQQLPDMVRKVLEPKYWDGHDHRKAKVLDAVLEYQRKPGDTGSAEVQIAVLTRRLEVLKEQVKRKRTDNKAKFLVEYLTSRRQRLLQYLARQNKDHCAQVMARLGLDASEMFPKDTGTTYKKHHPFIRFSDMKKGTAKVAAEQLKIQNNVETASRV